MNSQRDPVTAYVGLGGNLGDAAAAIRAALNALNHLSGTRVHRVSSLYRSAPVDSSGPDYLNAVAGLITTLDAPSLLSELLRIEAEAGRERPYLNAPRILDLDLLLYGSARIDSSQLTVPHPRMHQRAFVLLPLAEIAPESVDEQSLQEVAGQIITRAGDLKD